MVHHELPFLKGDCPTEMYVICLWGINFIAENSFERWFSNTSYS